MKFYLALLVNDFYMLSTKEVLFSIAVQKFLHCIHKINLI